MAERARNGNGRSAFPRARNFGTTAATAGQAFNWIWSRESLLRLLLSLVLALALWLYVTNRENPRLVQDYGEPLQIGTLSPPDGMTLSNPNLGVDYLRIRRTDPSVPITPASFRVFVNLAGLPPGRHVVPVHVVSDPGIQVVGRQPASVTVYLQRKQNRRVPVKVGILTKPPPGYSWNLTYSPSSVTVTGAAGLVSQVKRATAYIDLHGLTSTLTRDYQLNPETAAGNGVTGTLSMSQTLVHVTVTIHPYSSYKTLPVLVQFSGLPKQGYGVAGVRVDPAEIAASGSLSALKTVSALHTASISVNKRGGGSFTRKVQLQLPKGLHTKTHHVTVVVEVAPVESSTSVEIGVQPNGVRPGLITHSIPGRVLVTVIGPSNVLHNIAGTIHATVNLAGYGPGVYQIRTVVTSRQKNVKVEGVYPQLVTVQLRAAG